METIELLEPTVSRNATLMARAYDHKLRKQIIQLLLQEGEMDVTSIYTHRKFRDQRGLYLEQSQTSQHLAILRNAGLVVSTVDGKRRLYSVNRENLLYVQDKLRQLAERYN